MVTIRGQILVSRTDDDPLPSVWIQNVPVCTFKTSPCVPAPRPHVLHTVTFLKPHTGFSTFFAACRNTHKHTHEHTHTHTHHDHNDTHHTTQHTTSHGDRERKRERQREKERERDKTRQEKTVQDKKTREDEGGETRQDKRR